MTRTTLLAALLLLPLVACGGEPEPEKTNAPESATGPIDATISPDVLTLGEQEWFSATGNRITGIIGLATDEDGRPLPGATAALLIPAPVPMAPELEVRRERADEAGVFRFADVPRNARVRVSADGVASWTLPAKDLLVVGGAPREVPLPAAGEIRGRVVEDDGSPVAGVEIVVGDLAMHFLAVARTDEEGSFHVPAAAPLEMTAGVVSEHLVGRSRPFRVRRGETTEVTVVVERPAPVTLEVSDEATGRPLLGVVGSTLSVREVGVPTDAEGKLVVEGPCFPKIWLRGRGFAETPVELRAGRASPVTVPVTLRAAGTVRGRVEDPTGKPVEGARVRVVVGRDERALPVRGPRSDPDGRFELSWIPVPPSQADCAVFAEKPGWYLKVAPIRPVRTGEPPEDAVVVLDRLRGAKLRVVGEDGEPVTGALVTLVGITPFHAGPFATFTTVSSGLTDADGRVTFSGVAPQRMRITVQAVSRLPYREERPVAETGEIDLGEVRLPPGFSVAGRVRSTSGTVPEGTRVFVSVPGAQVEVPVQPDGAFRCSGLPEGAVNLRVKAPRHEILNSGANAGDTDLDLVITALGSIELKLERPAEAAVPGWLEIRPVGGDVHNRSATVREFGAKLDAWKFPGLVAGTYRIRVQAGDWFARDEVKLAHGAELSVKLEMARGATIRGVLLRPDRTPAARTGLKLVAGAETDRQSRVTDEEGRFEFRGIPPGEVTLNSHPAGFAPSRQVVTAVGGEDTEVEFVLRAGGKIVIAVETVDGGALPGVRVALSDADGPARFWVEGGGAAVTDDAGTVVLTGLSAGEYDLSLFRSGVRRPCGKVSVAEGDTAEVKVVWK